MAHKPKPPLRTDEDGHPIDIEGIDASPEAVGRAMLTPKAREMREKARRKRTKREQPGITL